MASRSERFGLSLLSVCQGHLLYIYNVKDIRILDDPMYALMEGVEAAMKAWPGNFSDKEVQKMSKVIENWGEWIEQEGSKDKLTILWSIVSHCLCDLYSVTKSASKLRLINPLFPYFKVLEQRIDPAGSQYDTYTVVRHWLNNLYPYIDAPSDFYD